MPFEIMDQRAVPTSSHFFKEIGFPSEREDGFWKPKIMHDHHDGIVRTHGSNAIASSSLEKLFPIGARSADCLEPLLSCVVRDQKEKIRIGGEEGTADLSPASGRYVNQNQKTWPNLYVPASPYNAERNRTKINGTLYESSLFSSSLSEVFSRKLGLSASEDLVHKCVDTAALHCEAVEPSGSTEEIEAQTIGNLLPNEDDLLSGVVDELECIAHANGVDDVEDLDLFSSGGGMELGDNCSHVCQRNSDFTGWISNGHGSSNGSLASENPYVEHPSRTLFVRNINSNVEDSELRALFEQYGDIRILYTACKHRGFVMISYYDKRAARNAMRALQNKPLRRRKLDIHYSIPKDNPSEKDINHDTVVVFNLNSSVSNYELRQIFGIYGDIKEIHETPHKHHHKFIEFYDVRAAEAALCALNRCGIVGKQIKLESSHPGGTRCLMRQCSELGHDGSGPCQSPNDNLSSEYMVVSPGGTTPSCIDNRSIQGLHSASQVPTSAFSENALHHGSSSLPNSLPSPVRVPSAGNHFGLREPSHSLDQVKLGNQCIPSFRPDSFPEHHDSFINILPYNCSSTVADMASNIGLRVADMTNDKHICMVGSSGQLMELNGGVFGSSGNGTCPLHGHRYVWSNFNSFQRHPSSSLIWSNSPSFVNGLHVRCSQQLPGFSGAPPHMLNTVSPAHHVRSAPTVNRSLWDGRHDYTVESPEASGFQLGSLGSVGFTGSSPLHPLERAHNSFSIVGENCMDMLTSDTPHSPHQISHIFTGGNAVTSMPTSFGYPNEHVRNLSHRGNGDSSGHADKKQFELEVDCILHGKDSRTTLMIKNIPNKYTSKMLLAAIDEHCRGTYDFIYLPIDFKNKCNVGYAFINMIDPLQIIPFHKVFNGKKWEKFNSEKVASLAYARIQGKAALIAHFQNSSLMNEDKRCRPILFRTDGPNAGDQEPFPMGTNIRLRPSKSRGLGDEDNHHRGSPLTSVNGEESSNGTDSSSGPARDLDLPSCFSRRTN
uniref:RRM domain-containing protein n=1 Tax=Davidia involucrata TaxID=16924 RepID=A0A5B7BU13_DAVIN